MVAPGRSLKFLMVQLLQNIELCNTLALVVIMLILGLKTHGHRGSQAVHDV